MSDEYEVYGVEMAAAVMVNGILDVPSGFLGDESSHPLWFHPNYALVEAFIDYSMAQAREASESAARQASESGPAIRQRKRRVTFHLVGTPGIGKTYFGLYWFYKQAKAKAKVIWRTKGDDHVYLYYDFSLPNPLVLESPTYTVPSKGWNRVWLIIDGESNGLAKHYGPVLQCVSPGRSGYHEGTGITCYFGAWNMDHVKSCRNALRLPIDDLQLLERFYVCGGLPRLLFDELKTLPQLRADMDSANCKIRGLEGSG